MELLLLLSREATIGGPWRSVCADFCPNMGIKFNCRSIEAVARRPHSLSAYQPCCLSLCEVRLHRAESVLPASAAPTTDVAHSAPLLS